MRVQGHPVVIILSRSSIRFGWLFFYRLKIRNVQNISCSTINLGPGLQSILTHANNLGLWTKNFRDAPGPTYTNQISKFSAKAYTNNVRTKDFLRQGMRRQRAPLVNIHRFNSFFGKNSTFLQPEKTCLFQFFWRKSHDYSQTMYLIDILSLTGGADVGRSWLVYTRI